ncbi:amiloride-sensitive sodium channel subunit beta-like [Stylophora pistillata]|uniref:amiloride-sensitive sodium channel subunit beta-like n=1 Tax=Stylophora pistillata TaxID=50429 RepID=UPI000C046802|nr:amiloride-sensitive sodium channel subunit beta-like [Stylophora pistillata]
MGCENNTVDLQEVEDASRLKRNSINTRDSHPQRPKVEGWKTFAQDTTLHGARFFSTDNVFRRFVWIAAVSGCAFFCIYQVYSFLGHYYERPFGTTITVDIRDDNTDLPFPAVTLCNFNALDKRRYINYYLTHNYSKEILDKKLQDLVLMIRRSKAVSTEEVRNRTPELFYRPEVGDETEMSQWMFGHQIERMLLPNSPRFSSCSINGLQCNEDNFTSSLSAVGFKCYTFNSAEEGGLLLKASLAGRLSGLSLRLNIERDSYITNLLSPAVGIVILIHDQKIYPPVEEFGIAIQPGMSTFCAIKRRKIINLKKPYATNCRSGSLMFDSNLTYTKQACMINCRNDYMIKECGCTASKFQANRPIPVCSVNDSILCAFPSYVKFGTSQERTECEKECREPCEHVEYRTSFSYSGLQKDAYIEHFMSILNDNATSAMELEMYRPLLNMTEEEKEKFIDKNIISLDIFFEDLSVEIIEQKPVFEIWALTGNLGGTFGLFLGMSVLTFLEFFDFIFRRILHLFKAREKNRHFT